MKYLNCNVFPKKLDINVIMRTRFSVIVFLLARQEGTVDDAWGFLLVFVSVISGRSRSSFRSIYHETVV